VTTPDISAFFPDDKTSEERLRALLAGRVALATALEEAGGVLLGAEAAGHLKVSRETLQNWHDKGQILALEAADGSAIYPVAQFERPSHDVSHPRPFKAIAEIRRVAGDWLAVDELIGLLTSRHDALADAAGRRTGFKAIADGDAPRVVAMVRHVRTPADA